MNIKVCGMMYEENVKSVADAVYPQYMGFIFYDGSKRFLGEGDHSDLFKAVPAGVKKVGVFVDQEVEEIKEIMERYSLDLVQLHGSETPETCQELEDANYMVIKAFAVDEDFDFSDLDDYEDACTYYLFDTKSGGESGGTGEKFDWDLLENYKQEKLFFLSGGIEPEDAHLVNQLDMPLLHAVDINSRFEISTGNKDVLRIKTFKDELR